MSVEPHWSLSEAKGRLLEILERANALPQVIADAGRPCAVVLSLRDFEDISGFSRRRLRNLLLEREAGKGSGGPTPKSDTAGFASGCACGR